MRWGHISFPMMEEISCEDCEYFLHLALMIQSILEFHLVMVLSAAGDETPCNCLLIPLSFPSPSLCNEEQN